MPFDGDHATPDDLEGDGADRQDLADGVEVDRIVRCRHGELDVDPELVVVAAGQERHRWNQIVADGVAHRTDGRPWSTLWPRRSTPEPSSMK